MSHYIVDYGEGRGELKKDEQIRYMIDVQPKPPTAWSDMMGSTEHRLPNIVFVQSVSDVVGIKAVVLVVADRVSNVILSFVL